MHPAITLYTSFYLTSSAHSLILMLDAASTGISVNIGIFSYIYYKSLMRFSEYFKSASLNPWTLRVL